MIFYEKNKFLSSFANLDLFRKFTSKTQIRNREAEDFFDGKPYISTKNVFSMAIDRKQGGDRCRFKLHYTGCKKSDKKGQDCLKILEKFVEAKRQTQKVGGKTRTLNPKKTPKNKGSRKKRPISKPWKYQNQVFPTNIIG